MILSEDKKELTQDEKIEKAKALIRELKELELSDEDMKAVEGGVRVAVFQKKYPGD